MHMDLEDLPYTIKTEKTAPHGVGVERPCYMLICPHCKEEIPGNMVQQGGLHMGCFEAEIDVWFVSLPDSPKCGYYENDVQQVANMLKDSEDAYLIERKQMTAGEFYNLPEFKGF